MKNDGNAEKVGVLIGRFEVAELTDGYRQLLDWFIEQGFGTNILILGNAQVLCTKNNPLDYESRRLMIEEAYPGKVSLHYLMDQALDEKWSENLDRIVDDTRSNRDVVLIGSKDYFYNHYFGKYRGSFVEYLPKSFPSGAEHRKSVSKQLKCSKEWRAGVIWATANRYPTVYSTADCAVFESAELEHIYLARKPNEKLLRFVGGFADPKDDSFEETALREAKEETGLDCDIIQYVCSRKIDDWRYRNEQDKIITHLFAMTKKGGRANATDDVAELQLREFDRIGETEIVAEHRELFKRLSEWREAWLKANPSMKRIVRDMMD